MTRTEKVALQARKKNLGCVLREGESHSGFLVDLSKIKTPLSLRESCTIHHTLKWQDLLKEALLPQQKAGNPKT